MSSRACISCTCFIRALRWRLVSSAIVLLLVDVEVDDVLDQLVSVELEVSLCVDRGVHLTQPVLDDAEELDVSGEGHVRVNAGAVGSGDGGFRGGRLCHLCVD